MYDTNGQLKQHYYFNSNSFVPLLESQQFKNIGKSFSMVDNVLDFENIKIVLHSVYGYDASNIVKVIKNHG